MSFAYFNNGDLAIMTRQHSFFSCNCNGYTTTGICPPKLQYSIKRKSFPASSDIDSGERRHENKYMESSGDDCKTMWWQSKRGMEFLHLMKAQDPFLGNVIFKMTSYVVVILDFSKQLHNNSIFSLSHKIKHTLDLAIQISNYYGITVDSSFYVVLL